MFGFFKKNKETQAAPKEVTVYAVATGELVDITKVNDPVFAQKMMGDGYAIIPTDNVITSPVNGKVMNVFPTKHAVGFSADGLEILLHMGIDTVALNGAPFDTVVAEGQDVTPDTTVSTVDLGMLEAEGKDNAMMVIFTNGNDVIESFELTASGQVQHGAPIGKIVLK